MVSILIAGNFCGAKYSWLKVCMTTNILPTNEAFCPLKITRTLYLHEIVLRVDTPYIIVLFSNVLYNVNVSCGKLNVGTVVCQVVLIVNTM